MTGRRKQDVDRVRAPAPNVVRGLVEASPKSSGKSAALGAVLGVLPHLFWFGFGLAGGLFVAPFYPALAGYIGWTIRSAAAGQCWREVTLSAFIAAMGFTGVFFISVPDLRQFYSPLVSAAGGMAVFFGAFLAASAFIGLGVAARSVSLAA